MIEKFNEAYYKFNNQNKDRIGNLFYSNLIKKNFKFKTYLDFGCGTGLLLKKLEKIKNLDKLYGYEINDFAIEQSVKNTERSKIFKSLNEIDKNIDLISMIHIVEHINDLELVQIFKKLRSKINKNGNILVATPAKDGLAHKIKKHKWIAFKDPTHINIKNYEDWNFFFKSQNLNIVNTFSDGLWDFPYKGLFNFIKYINIYLIMIVQIFLGKLMLKYNEGETLIFILKFNE